MKKIYQTLFGVLLASPLLAQTYCTPVCSNPAGGCTYGPVNRIEIPSAAGLFKDTLGCTGTGYEDRTLVTSITGTFNAGSTYTLTLTGPYPSPKNSQLWIDFDNDGVFASTESIGGVNSWGYTTTATLTIPTTATAGARRMRFVSEYGGMIYYPSINPCMGATSYMFADARDYVITVGSGSSAACTGAPTGGTASYTSSYTCGHNAITLTDAGASSGTGISYQWEKSSDGGTTWTAISGATATTYTFAQENQNMKYRCAVTCSGGSTTNSSSVSVNVNRINGHITYSSAVPDTQSLKVWLIYHNTTAGTLTAVDSVITCLDSALPYYEFNGMTSGSYLVKAKSLDVTSSVVGASGYVPTYGASSAVWSGATTVSHTGPYDSLHITMIYGTVPSGPGFVGGYISSGAGKGTAGDVPAANMLVFLQNTTSNVLTQTYTDASGNYSFSGIAAGNYIVYPEKIEYATTASAIVSITASASSVTGVNFKEYTTSKTIKPVSISSVATSGAMSNDIVVFPNPATNDITVAWSQSERALVDLTIIDVMGRVVMAKQLDLGNGQGRSNISIANIPNGVYTIRLNGNGVTFTEKLNVVR
jgi:hypothetical protein